MSESKKTGKPIARREALKLVVAGVAAAPLVGFGKEHRLVAKPARPSTDPDLVNPVVPWDNILTDMEMKTVTALCDVILPQDDISASASSVGVPDFINEWVSAPYPDQERDRQTIRGGLVWLNTESGKRYDSAFHALEKGPVRVRPRAPTKSTVYSHFSQFAVTLREG